MHKIVCGCCWVGKVKMTMLKSSFSLNRRILHTSKEGILRDNQPQQEIRRMEMGRIIFRPASLQVFAVHPTRSGYATMRPKHKLAGECYPPAKEFLWCAQVRLDLF